MTGPGTGFPQWAMVDEGWGRKAADFAALSEPGQGLPRRARGAEPQAPQPRTPVKMNWCSITLVR